ncbi:monooxygenase [Microdochium trichocladiopsis]|uniref:Monooxygenase n=1 Tax=Microdochium trichocladiopsis TaxID=1682393 RepID=A0A9P8Y7N3_9PEZI|nr:monooxygenase [Microdochium trichocladiopsis]KAH7029661.1 monooxygenase [Microdochium trichocladiopsis]
MATKDFHVAIVGAGIGGLALAMALHKKGISFTLYEEAKEYSAVGAGIGFAPNGMRTMDLIEPGFRPLYEAVCVGNRGEDAQHIFFEGMLLKEGFGRDQPWYGKSGWGHVDYVRKSAHRKTLLDIMTSFIPVESVQFNKCLAGSEQQPSGVLLSFADGTTATASFLAGADGIQSTVREHVLKELYPDQVAPVYSGAYCYRAVIPMSEAYEILGDLTDVAKFYFGHKRSCITYRISGGEEFNFLLCVADGLDGWKLKNAVTEKISHEAMMADFDSPDTVSYTRDRVILVGDSAHASLPFQAAGAAQGLEDALVLSNVLAELAGMPERGAAQMPAIRAGMAAYDSIRRPRAQKQLEQADEVSRMMFLEHEEAGGDVEKILPLLQQGRFNWLWFHDMDDDVQEVLRRMRKQISVGSQPAAARI